MGWQSSSTLSSLLLDCFLSPAAAAVAAVRVARKDVPTSLLVCLKTYSHCLPSVELCCLCVTRNEGQTDLIQRVNWNFEICNESSQLPPRSGLPRDSAAPLRVNKVSVN